MKRLPLLTVFVFALFLISVQTAMAVVSCEVIDTGTESCDDGAVILKLSDADDAHAALYDNADFQYAICCHEITSTVRTCSGPSDDPDNLIIRLSAIADAHASAGSNFQTDVCLGDLSCVAGDDCSSFGTDWFCILSLSDPTTDAHTGSCTGAFTTKICCNEQGEEPVDTLPPETTLNDYPEEVTEEHVLTFTGSAVDYGGSNVAVIQYRYSSNGGSVWSDWVDVSEFTPDTAVNFEFTTPELEDGDYTFEARATDSLDNEEQFPYSSVGVTIYTEVCGNGQIGGTEDCDGIELQDQTCETLELGDGELVCYAAGEENECSFDVSGCELAPDIICIPGEEDCFGDYLKRCSNNGITWITTQY